MDEFEMIYEEIEIFVFATIKVAMFTHVF